MDPIIEMHLDRIESHPTYPAKYKRLLKTALLHYDNEANNCTVLAVALATGVSYGKAHAALARAGRVTGDGATDSVIEKAMAELGFIMKLTLEFEGKSLAAVRNAGGNRFAIVRGRSKSATHILTVKDGVIYDYSGSRKRVMYAYEIEEAPVHA